MSSSNETSGRAGGDVKKTILIVDDMLTERIHLRKILERNGYNVIEAQSGNEASRMAESTMPAAIMMDVVMPDMNGFQATREIKRKQSTRNIPIIMVTTKDREPDRANAKDNGACAYLVKPASELAVLSALATAGLPDRHGRF